jgi:hypothetical protein
VGGASVHHEYGVELAAMDDGGGRNRHRDGVAHRQPNPAELSRAEPGRLRQVDLDEPGSRRVVGRRMNLGGPTGVG